VEPINKNAPVRRRDCAFGEKGLTAYRNRSMLQGRSHNMERIVLFAGLMSTSTTIHSVNVPRSAQNLIGLSSGCTFLSVLKAVESYPAQHLSLKHYRGLDCLLAGMMRSLDNSNSSSPPSGYTLAPLSIGARTQPLNCGLGSLHPRNYHFTIEH